MENLILEKAKYWATSSVFDTETQNEIGQLIEAGDEKELSERFYQNLQLGTGDIRINIMTSHDFTNCLCEFSRKASRIIRNSNFNFLIWK